MQKLLPPFLFILFAIAVGLYSFIFNPVTYIAFPVSVIGIAVALLGILLAVLAKRQFTQIKANVQTFSQPSVLVTDGMFQYSRNPMYLGFVVALMGICIANGMAIEHLILEMLFIVIVRKWYIAFEEKMMLRTFGQEYVDYCQQVRRWL